MQLKNVLIVTNNMECSIKFYKDLFGLHVILNSDGNVIMTEGLVLQDQQVWERFLDKDVIAENNSSELYFEERDIEAFVEKLEAYEIPVKYVNKLMQHSWGKKVVRFYDPDGNLIEVATPV